MAISYPITDFTKRFTFILDGEIRRRREWPNTDGTALTGGKNAAAIALEETLLPDPAFDPATQRLGGIIWTDDIPNEATTGVREVLTLTTEELAERQREQQLDSQETQAKAIYQDLKNGVGNAAARVQRCERVLAWLLRREFEDNEIGE